MLNVSLDKHYISIIYIIYSYISLLSSSNSLLPENHKVQVEQKQTTPYVRLVCLGLLLDSVIVPNIPSEDNSSIAQVETEQCH